MTDTYADFEPLHSLLGMQLKVNQQLLALAEEQRRSIIENETEKLDGLVQRQAAQLRQLAALEKKRLDFTAHLPAALGLPERPLTLSELIAYAEPAQQPGLRSLLEEFADLLARLKEANNTNKLLLQTNIELSELMLSLLADNADPLNNLYRGDGSKAEEAPPGPSLFDHQV
jgi:flagellar biosynthesis/type III secretory pathway chaperone